MIDRYLDAFAANDDALGDTMVMEHRMNTGDAFPIRRTYDLFGIIGDTLLRKSSIDILNYKSCERPIPANAIGLPQ